MVSTLVLLAVVLPVVAAILLSSYSVQNYVVGRLTKVFSEKLGTTVSIDRVGIKFFNRATFDGVYVEDYQGDTLLYVRHLDAGFRGYHFGTGLVRLGDVRLDGANFRVAQDSTGTTNLSALLAGLKNDKPKSKKSFALRANSLTVDSTRFRFRKYPVPERKGAINFSDLDIRDLALRFEGIRVDGDSIQLSINSLSASEKSGFRLREFSGQNVRVGSRGIRIADLQLRDDDSQVSMPELALVYPGWKAFGDFVKSVDIHSVIVSSRLAMRTIGWFAPSLGTWRSVVQLNGTFDGPVSDLTGRLDDAVIGDTRLRTRFSIAGLPEIQKTRFNFDISELATHAASAGTIFRDITGRELAAGAVQWLDRLGEMTLTGTFDGLLSDFQTDAKLTSAPGEAKFQLRVNPEAGGRTRLDGNVALAEFQLGRLLKVEKLGTATLSARLDGYLGSDSMLLATDASIDHLRFNGYHYRGIRANGDIRNKYYKGLIASADPNVDFRLDGTFDFDRTIPKYDFDLKINRLDLHALHFNERDSVSVLQAVMRVDAQGTTLEGITGQGTIPELTYWYPGDSIRSENMTILGDNLSSQKRLRLASDFLDAELTGRSSLVDLLPAVRRTLHYYLPSLDPAVLPVPASDSLQRAGAEDYYALQLNIKEAGERAVAALVPGLYIAPGTNLSTVFNPSTSNFSMILHSDLIQYKSIYIANLDATNRNEADSIALYLRTDEVALGNFYMPKLTVHGGIRDNRVSLSTGFDNPQNGLSAMLNTVSRMQPDSLSGKNVWHTRFTASRIGIGGQQWRISSPDIAWGGEAITVNQFRVLTTGQEFLLDGRLSTLPADTLHLSMSDFDLSPLSGLLDRFGYGISGRMSGSAELIGGRSEAPLFYGHLDFNDLVFNGKRVPNSTFVSEWNPVQERVDISLRLASGQTVIQGQYHTKSKQYELDAALPGLDLALLNPVLKGVLTDVQGAADVGLKLSGTGKQPALNGTIAVKTFAGTVDFTRARYHFSDAVIRVENNNLILPKTVIRDDEGGEGDLELTLRTRNLSQLSYTVHVAPRRMLALNSTAADNDFFYGKAYASGTVGITGDPHAIDMQINVATEDNSSFFMPLNGASSVSRADFIVFEDPNDGETQDSLSRYEQMKQMREQQKNGPAQKSSLNIDLNIDVRPNTQVELVIDPQNGGTIKADGTGRISLHLQPRENVFTMFGDYRINTGNFELTLMDIQLKNFTIEPGSSIQWFGDPLNAVLDVTASYRVRASTAPITGGNRVVPVDCRILLTDRLSQPTINFDVSLPTADADFQSALQAAMNTQEQKAQQFVSLFLSNRFSGTTDNIGTASTAASTGIEFLTNQLGHWLSNERFSFNVGYTLGNRQMETSDEVESTFSWVLIPGKLFFEGEGRYNLGTNTADPRSNQFSGDFQLTYSIGNSGNLRAKGFSRTIDRYDENQGLQEYGLGLYYTRDFDRWRNLFRRSRPAVQVK